MKRMYVKTALALLLASVAIGVGAGVNRMSPQLGPLIWAAAPPVSASGLSSAPGAAPASQPAGSSFTYQGRLVNNGQPASGQYDFTFKLFDAATGGTQIGTGNSINAQQVTTGVFTVALNFGTSAFRGDARWLETAVRPTGGRNYTTLSPRQQLTSTPYAQSLVPGAMIWGTVSNGGTLNVRNYATDGWGVLASGNGGGVYGASSSTGSAGVYGANPSGPGVYGNGSLGVAGSGSGQFGRGVLGFSTGEYGAGVGGSSTGEYSIGVGGSSTGPSGVGVSAYSESPDGAAIVGFSMSGVGVWGWSNYGYGTAGYFNGNVQVTGTCCGMAEGYSQIDHPLDPANKVLNQALVQSPDMLEMYNGNVTTDASGEAVVQLPPYFEAINKDFRYQLTVVGQFAQAIVSSKVKDNRFTIKTDKPNVEVSWQVTGVRQDAYAKAHPITPEQEKAAKDKGK